MKMRWLGLLLLSCHPKTKPMAEDAAPPAPSASVAVVEAGSPPAPTSALTWGARPSEKGPLFPVVDGLCGSATIRALDGKTIYYGETFARFEDDGLVVDDAYEKPAEKSKAIAWAQTSYADVSGTWPRLVLFSRDRGGGRMRSFESIWVHEETGWSYFGSSEEKDEPSYTVPIHYKDWLITSRRGMTGANADGPPAPALIHAWPMKKDAPPVPGLASLGRQGFTAAWLASAGDSLYAFGWNEAERAFTNVVRVLKDGKVSEGANPQNGSLVIGKKDDSLFLLGDDSVIRRFDGTKVTALPIKPKGGALIMGAAVAPNGDIWAITSKSEVMILHGDAVTTTALPAPASKPSATTAPTFPANHRLAGVEIDEPWAIDETGVLYRFENGKWHEIPMPTPPFATTGKYRAQSVTLPAKGDPYVSAGYYEKGIGWKNGKSYNAVLRTRRPKETQRCNEAPKQFRIDRLEVGHGFFSSPPIADDTCATPFVVIVRLGTKKEPNFLYDRGYPTLRAAIKETPGLGATAEILEIPWGTVQAIGMKAPDMTTAKALALNAAKHVKSEYQETEPEIVCGVPPTVDKTMLVDVATGKFVTPDAH